ncbi:MAG TPA: AIR synthase related protein, partial [Candidatus Limnocylindria bacterium]|nr:AIR synthase related protein [Candidatus Limnocylindria bacterium]
MARSYREAGVDIDEGRRAVDLIARAAASTANASVLGGIGGFGSLFRFDPSSHPDPVLVASTDGVGTKLKVALALGRHDTIGVDLVHHCINDIAVQGADPLFFLDYLAMGSLRADVAGEIVGGIAAA